MQNWIQQLKCNPIPVLVKSENKAISYFVRRDLLKDSVESIKTLWKLPEALKIFCRQKEDGSWKYPSAKIDIRSRENYDQLETYRILGILVEKYGFAKEHPAIRKSADFLFSFQTAEGDFRGIYGNQYTPNYSAAIMELLTKAGYDTDTRIEKGFCWLLNMRQNDGGWAIPTRTLGGENSLTLMQAIRAKEPLKPDKARPFSHLVTGVVLRAFAAHPRYRRTREARLAGELLKSRFFQADKYPDRKATSFWTKFSYPFWFTDLLSSLDSLSVLGFSPRSAGVKEGLKWFVDNQRENGPWNHITLLKGGDKALVFWVTLAICRVFNRFYNSDMESKDEG